MSQKKKKEEADAHERDGTEDGYASQKEVSLYERLEKLGEGTYGVVYKASFGINLMSLPTARHRVASTLVALKRIKLESQREGIPCNAIREISFLKALHHPNILRLQDVMYTRKRITLVFEFCDQDLKKFLDSSRTPLEHATVQRLLYQIMLGLAHCHKLKILHRDIKPHNLLMNNKGTNIKLADFGLARSFVVPVKKYTAEVVTLWYRSPDVLLGSTNYNTAIDVWSVGCVFAEMSTKKPIFSGGNVQEQMQSIISVLGSPSLDTWPAVQILPRFQESYLDFKPGAGLAARVPRLSAVGCDLLSLMLAYNPEDRILTDHVLAHPYFHDMSNSPHPATESSPAVSDVMDDREDFS